MLFFEDIVVGHCAEGPSVTVDRDELVEFAKKWDPMPFHVDEQAGKEAFGGITAPGVFVLALKQRLVHQMPSAQSVIASFGFDEVRFHQPLRPGDTVHLRREWISKRTSKSKPDRGIATMRFSLINQNGATVMSHLDTVLVRCKALPQ